VVLSTDEAVSDFLSFHPLPARTRTNDEPSFYLLVGSERGFCGAFNDMVIARLKQLADSQDQSKPVSLVVIGDRFASKMTDDVRVRSAFAGLSAV
jgi:F-type H+-transporting ATPase subunit gamma